MKYVFLIFSNKKIPLPQVGVFHQLDLVVGTYAVGENTNRRQFF